MGYITLSSGKRVKNPYLLGEREVKLLRLSKEEKRLFSLQFNEIFKTKDKKLRKLYNGRKDLMEIGICAIKAEANKDENNILLLGEPQYFPTKRFLA